MGVCGLMYTTFSLHVLRQYVDIRLLLQFSLALIIVVKVRKVLRDKLVLSLLLYDLPIEAPDQDRGVLFGKGVVAFEGFIELELVNMYDIVVNCVRLVVHDVEGVVLVGLHLQVAIHKCLARANLNINLISFLPLHITVRDEYFGLIIRSVPVLLLAIIQCIRSQVITSSVIIKVIINTPVRLCLGSLIHKAKLLVARGLSQLCILLLTILFQKELDRCRLSSLNLIVIAEVCLSTHSL